MKLPNKINLNSREINVKVQEEPFMVFDNENPNDVRELLGYYNRKKLEMGVFVNPENPSVGEALFFHELVEAIDVHGDFGLDHNSITVLGNNLHQVFKQILEYNLCQQEVA